MAEEREELRNESVRLFIFTGPRKTAPALPSPLQQTPPTHPQAVFTAEKIEPLVMAALDNVLTGKVYAEAEVDGWVNSICEEALASLAELDIPFKFIVSAMLMQNTGAGVNAALAEFCDGAVDGACITKWPQEKNKDKTNMLACVTVIGVALFRES